MLLASVNIVSAHAKTPENNTMKINRHIGDWMKYSATIEHVGSADAMTITNALMAMLTFPSP